MLGGILTEPLKDLTAVALLRTERPWSEKVKRGDGISEADGGNSMNTEAVASVRARCSNNFGYC